MSKPFHNPFAALSEITGVQPAAPTPAATRPEAPVKTPASIGGRTIPRAVVRLERSGRGGKEVTAIEHLALSPADRDVWLKALKAALGCGGTLEGDAIILQGDQRTRLPKILTARGVKKITVA